MAWQDDLEQLSDGVLETFGESVTVTRHTSAGFDATVGTELKVTTGPVTMTADVQARRQFAQQFGGGANGVVEQVVMLFAVEAWTDAGLGQPRPNDVVSHGGINRRVVGVDLEVGGKMWRVTCRDEKKRG